MRKLARQSCENGVQSSNHKFVDVFLICLSDVEHSARTAEIELSLICGDFDDSCPWVMVSEPRAINYRTPVLRKTGAEHPIIMNLEYYDKYII